MITRKLVKWCWTTSSELPLTWYLQEAAATSMVGGRGKFGAIRIKKLGGEAHEAGIQIYGEKRFCPVCSAKTEAQRKNITEPGPRPLSGCFPSLLLYLRGNKGPGWGRLKEELELEPTATAKAKGHCQSDTCRYSKQNWRSESLIFPLAFWPFSSSWQSLTWKLLAKEGYSCWIPGCTSPSRVWQGGCWSEIMG